MFTAAVVDVDPDAEVPWLATAYVPAPSLRRMVQVCGPLPPATVQWLAAGCAEALESIHRAGLVHMDLKPANVLVGADGPRVIDFGVARAAGQMILNATRGVIGTPAYMAPEQAQNLTRASAASDVFSLGATLLYAATGHAPYLGETTADVLVMLATEPPDLAGLPEELTGLITACLGRVPQDRPSSLAILAQLGNSPKAQTGQTGVHPYLPAEAVALIKNYHPRPYTAASSEIGDDHGSEATDPSCPELPAAYRSVPRPSDYKQPRWIRVLKALIRR